MIMSVIERYHWHVSDEVEFKKLHREFFDQYLNYAYLPEFQYRLIQEGRDVVLLYRWEAIKDFNMPVLVYNGYKDIWIYPTNSWKEINLGNIDKFDFHVLDDMFLIDIKRIE